MAASSKASWLSRWFRLKHYSAAIDATSIEGASIEDVLAVSEEGVLAAVTTEKVPPEDLLVDHHHLEIAAPYFDKSYYLAKNTDVRDANIDPLKHFLIWGWRERRNPSLSFDVNFYLQTYPDVAAADVNPLIHFIMAGQAEGREARDPLGIWRRRLEAARAPSKGGTAASLNNQAVDQIDGDELIDRLNISQMGSGLIISFSHDDYTRSCGGVQNVIVDEQKAFNRAQWNYLHVSPMRPLQSLADILTIPADFIVAIRIDGTFLGHIAFDEFIAALVKTEARERGIKCIIHHLMGFSPELILKLFDITQIKSPVVWVHDLFTVCENYTLLRNDITFCGGPPPDSMACDICCYGEGRSEHYGRIQNFFQTTHPIVLAPSEFALEKWRHFELPHQQGVVVPPARLVFAEERFSIHTAPQQTLRVAYVGQRVFHKGWSVFEELALRFRQDQRYEFIQLGMPSHEVVLPDCIGYCHVQVGPDDHDAMIHALAAAHIDIVVLWPMWPETFCYVAHEALAAGVFIVTHKGAGNVDPVVTVQAPEQGIVLPDQSSLFALFETGDIIQLATKAVRRRGALIAGGGTADWLLRDNPALLAFG
ncbi:hypothetical protein Bind_0516 [Beijerinckia indica subsp. indica ATCC 9039]|uniref:Glycosyl transferase group 1 n=2 Tax=Beijerinckia TaxID=532 RepID=B2IEX7_BEII9|nr:hypothetical protein Bind_0516 [Beijerinckia indica subsp. indica ATCC 9039]